MQRATPSILRDWTGRAADLARSFAKRAAQHDAAGSFPFENFGALHDARLLALAIPRESGGEGAGLEACRRAVNTIAQGEPSTALVLAQQYLFQYAMFHTPDWNDALRKDIARSMVEEGALGNMLRVEPALGTPFRGGLPVTAARRVQNGWSLTGHKIFCTGIPILRWFGVWARTEDEEPLVGAWIVPRQATGWRVEETWDHLGMRATRSDDVYLEGVLVPEENAVNLAPPGPSGRPGTTQAGWTAVLFATVYDGIARASRDWIVGFLNDRVPSNLGKPLASLPRMQEAIGIIEALLFTNEALLANIASRIDGGETVPAHESFFMKFNVIRNAIEAVEKALEVSGNPGLDRKNPLQRHYRDALCGHVHSPQNDTILIEGGKRVLEAASLTSLHD